MVILTLGLGIGANTAIFRTSADTNAIAGIRALARQLDAHATLVDVATMEQIVSNSITRPRMYAVLVGIFAAVAISFAAVAMLASYVPARCAARVDPLVALRHE